MGNLDNLSKEQLEKLKVIAEKLNVSVEKLLIENPNPEELIQKYDSGNFRMLNE